jgi:subtilisin family serine protease
MNERLSKGYAIYRGSKHRARRPPRLPAVGWAMVAVASLLLAAPQLLAAPRKSLAQQPPAASSGARVVTLITGDRVIASGPGLESLRIERAAGRDEVRFITQRISVARGAKPHVFVIPDDAAPLLQSGKVDRRLFDVTLLLESGYDDAHRTSLPLIITYPRTSSARALPRVVPGAVLGRDLPSVNGVSVSSPKAQASQVWNAVVAAPGSGPLAAAIEPIGKLWLDGLLQPVLDHSVPQIGAPAAWDLGYEGDGVVVAVLDTGVDEAHPDLIDTVVVSENFTLTPDGDQVGHGTHVASIIAGSGAASGGLYRGVAPGVSLLSGKVCEDFGCAESSIILGMQWAAGEQGAQVINMSLNGMDTPGLDPLEETVETLSSIYGTLFVNSAGNSGSFLPVGTAGSTAAALTVGAVDREDDVADFSSRGLTVDGLLKPDITGPGVDIVAARAAGTELGTPFGEHYVALSGTSMAAPHVAGAAALILQQHPTWRGTDVKAALMGTAAYNPAGTTLEQGAGRVDVAAAIQASFLANASSLSLGIARWPHEDDEPTLRTVTYRNLGPAIELAIELDITGPDGSPPPADMFTVTPSSVSLSEGGTASVRLTANTAVAAPDGLYSGRVLAFDSAGRSLSIPLALVREVESYNLTLRHLDRQAQPTAQWFGSLFPYAGLPGLPWVDPPSTLPEDVTLRLPKGKYAYEVFMYSAVEPFDFVRVVAPNQLLDADRLLVLDASATVPVTVVSPAPGAVNLGVNETWIIQTELGPTGSSLSAGFEGDIAYYRGEIDPPEPSLLSTIDTQWVDSVESSSEAHIGAWTAEGRLPDARLVFDLENLATVDAHYSAPLTSLALINEVAAGAFWRPDAGFSISGVAVSLPLDRTEHFYSPDPSVRWINELWMHDEEYTQSIILGWVPYEYRAGHTYRTRWNEPVFSPSVPEATSIFEWAARDGDALAVLAPMYGDREGHGGFIASTGSAVLYRDDEIIGRSESGDGAFFEMPPEPGSYRLELDHHQAMFELTPRQQVAWTFQSGHVEEGSPQRIPLLVVRFTPELDERGRAPSGTRFCLPLAVDQFDREAAPAVSTPSVEASYDDGASWVAARVEADGSGWNAFLQHPEGADYVSLRASTHDASGNAVEQTLHRAYGLKTAQR